MYEEENQTIDFIIMYNYCHQRHGTHSLALNLVDANQYSLYVINDVRKAASCDVCHYAILLLKFTERNIFAIIEN